MFKLSGSVVLDITGKATTLRADMIFDFKGYQKIILIDLGNSMDGVHIFFFQVKKFNDKILHRKALKLRLISIFQPRIEIKAKQNKLHHIFRGYGLSHKYLIYLLLQPLDV